MPLFTPRTTPSTEPASGILSESPSSETQKAETGKPESLLSSSLLDRLLQFESSEPEGESEEALPSEEASAQPRPIEWGRSPGLLDAEAERGGLGYESRKRLRASRLRPHLEATMAASPACYGLRIWLQGETACVLDAKGYLCSTEDLIELLLLCRFESTLGPGAVRALLERQPIDPYAAVTIVKSAFKLKPDPVKKTSSAPKAPRRVISSAEFSKLLDSI